MLMRICSLLLILLASGCRSMEVEKWVIEGTVLEVRVDEGEERVILTRDPSTRVVFIDKPDLVLHEVQYSLKRTVGKKVRLSGIYQFIQLSKTKKLLSKFEVIENSPDHT